ncbi:MAG: fused MFS/spermidine synthase [Gemmatimonadota bacterium]
MQPSERAISTTEPRASASSPPFLPALLLLFVGSGAAALIYQVVWFQLLSLIIGSSAISLGVLLATFMGGMCIGSIALPRFIPRARHPLMVYAALEGGIALFGLLILAGLPWIGGLYTAIGGGGWVGFTTRAIVSAICLLPPTILMGATLPAIARWVEATPKGVSWLGFFYAGNIGGAVFGCLLAGFYLLRVHDMTVATLAAAGLNILVAVVGALLASRTAYAGERAIGEAAPVGIPPGSWPVLVAIGLSGLTALGAEVIWTRVLSLMLGGTVYTFSLILAAFLLGLGIGSGAGSFLARTLENPRTALGWCQLLLVAGFAWAAYSLTQALPFWPVNPSLASDAVFTFQLDFVRALWTVLPGAVLWGASFPLALAAVAGRDQDPARLVGVVYASNTLGAIVGSLVAALLLIGTIGTQSAQRLLIAVAALSALLLLVPQLMQGGKLVIRADGWIRGAAAIALAILLGASVAPVPGILVAYGRFTPGWLGYEGDIFYVGEGTHASLAVSRTTTGALNYHSAGKVQASSEPQDMRLQRLLGHLTTLIPDDPSSVMVIGLGAGVTAGSVSIDPAVQKVTIVELERLVPEVVSTYFSEHNFGVVDNPKVEVIVDDARHFLLTTDETFDAITSDPFDPWVKGAATLYTAEFFDLLKRRLNPGGVVTLFVQLYEAGLAAVKSEIATFVEAFPNATVWANTLQGQGYDLVLMGQVEPTRVDLAELDARLLRPEYTPVRNSLVEVGYYPVDYLFATYAGDGPDLTEWLSDAEVTRDRNLRLQYLAGRDLNLRQQDLTYRQIMSYATFPDDLFIGDPERIARLERQAMGK